MRVEKTTGYSAGQDSINEKLDRLDASLGKIGFKMGGEGLAILELMDEIDQQIKDAHKNGLNIKAEEGHYASLQAQIKREARSFLSEVGGTAALDAARPTRHQSPEVWWWRLDVYLENKRKNEQRRFLIGAGITIVLIGILTLVYNLFLAPDAATVARFESRQNAEQLAASGNPQEALVEVEKGLAAAPADAELLILKGCLLLQIDQKAEAEVVFQAAEKAAGSRENFLIQRSQSLYVLGNASASLADANEIINKVNPQSAIAYLLAGSAYEALKDPKQATAAYEKSYELADAQKNYQLAAQARIRLAYLSQSMMGSPFGGGQ